MQHLVKERCALRFSELLESNGFRWNLGPLSSDHHNFPRQLIQSEEFGKMGSRFMNQKEL